MYWVYDSLIKTNPTTKDLSDNLTAEDLGKAIKVLQDKKEELTKPVLTNKQELLLQHADKVCGTCIKTEAGEYCTVRRSEDYKQTPNLEIKEYIGSFYSYTEAVKGIVRYVLMIDSYGDLETYIDIDY